MIKNAIWLFAITSIILVVFLPSFSRMQDLRDKNADLRSQVLELKKKNRQLTQEKHLLESDPVYLEKVAREKMGLIRQGEVVYRLVPMNATK